MSSLSGKVALISGASRGIGREIALALAKEGCHIAVAAKSVESSPRLPGSVYTVAEEVRALGVRALPVPLDVRDVGRIETAVAEVEQEFGRIDILINNAGALWWHPMENTPLAKYDLVNEVNARGTFFMCRNVLPIMIRQHAGHIISMSPPIELALVPGRIAYFISKYGMTLVTHGLSEEVREHQVCVNSLWPRTLIESQAVINWGLGDPSMWRSARILSDCVLRIVTRDPPFTGRALLDEDFLREEGVTDFDQYACVPGGEPMQLGWGSAVHKPEDPFQSATLVR